MQCHSLFVKCCQKLAKIDTNCVEPLDQPSKIIANLSGDKFPIEVSTLVFRIAIYFFNVGTEIFFKLENLQVYGSSTKLNGLIAQHTHSM